ncbi:hypothetical protein GN958_ATG02835 [Phytophthora infestans]|uniref:Uncharacterized protein n=1 Tax=Phytophthora infestans TaxID=4787 RepID=A0A8S9UE86_PHYIN|nr:hypothetical protein GN958_ATG13016 [Phytophthora infestans]KAF4147970.1 hypothetical protein GN958_ATG02835 [Phytophthora infestans]
MTADEGRKLVERTDDKKRVVEMEERLIGRYMLDDSTEQEHRQQFQDSKKQPESHLRHSSQNLLGSVSAAVLATPISTDALPEAAPSRTPTLHNPAQRTPGRTLRTPIRRSPRLRTSTPQAHQRQSARQNIPTPLRSQADQGDEQAPDEDDLDDIGDGVDAEKTFPHWVEYLEEVFEDAELDSNFTDSYEDSLFPNWEFEEIPTPDNTPFPDTDDPMFLQERNIRGIRALKSPLAALFARSNSHSPPS